MHLSDILIQTRSLQSIAQKLAIPEEDVASATSALSPAIMGGFRKLAESHPQGLRGLGRLLDEVGAGRLLDAVIAPAPTNTLPGNDLLGQIFGSEQVGRAVIRNAALQTGQDPSLLKEILPMLAMVVAGYLAKHYSPAGASVGRTDNLGGVPGGVSGARQLPVSSGDALGQLFADGQSS